MNQIIFTGMCQLSQHIQINIFFKMFINISANSCTQMRGTFFDWSHCCGKVGLSCQMDNQNFHQILTDGFITRSFFLDFFKHVMQKKGYFFAHVAEINNAITVFQFFSYGKFQTFHAKYNILQRCGVQTDFGMLYVRIDNHQIVRRNRVNGTFDKKLSGSANYIEKFRALMGMGCGMPVPAVFGGSYIKKSCGISYTVVFLGDKVVSIIAHKALLVMKIIFIADKIDLSAR